MCYHVRAASAARRSPSCSRCKSHYCSTTALLQYTQLCSGLRFCHYLKINCRTLSGCARGGQSATGRRLRHELVTHSWNVVNVHNQWRVLDVAWGYECALAPRLLVVAVVVVVVVAAAAARIVQNAPRWCTARAGNSQ